MENSPSDPSAQESPARQNGQPEPVQAFPLHPKPVRYDQTPAMSCSGFAAWTAAGFVLPCFSPTFYRRAARASTVGAMGFFFLFALVITSVQTAGLTRTIVEVGGRIWDAYAEGTFPVIRISGGTAKVEGPQPYILYDQDGTLMAIDTSGAITDIDRRKYSQGLLLTRRHLITINRQGEYNRLSLAELQIVSGINELVLDGDTVTGTWAALGTMISLFGFLVLFLLNSLARMAILLVFGLLAWLAALLLRKETSFGEAVTVGIYAVVPATYLHFLLSQAGWDFPGLFTLLLLLVWAPALIASQVRSPERPARLWRTLIGLPVLLLMALYVIMGWISPTLLWAASALTMAVLVAVSAVPLFTRKASSIEAGFSP